MDNGTFTSYYWNYLQRYGRLLLIGDEVIYYQVDVIPTGRYYDDVDINEWNSYSQLVTYKSCLPVECGLSTCESADYPRPRVLGPRTIRVRKSFQSTGPRIVRVRNCIEASVLTVIQSVAHNTQLATLQSQCRTTKQCKGRRFGVSDYIRGRATSRPRVISTVTKLLTES